MKFYLKAKTMSLIPSFSKLSGWYRLLIVASIIGIIVTLINTDPWTETTDAGGLDKSEVD